MKCSILASGSKGNCIYVGNGTDAVVVDAGIGYLQDVITSCGLSTDNIRALCITHEHGDHCQTAPAFLNALRIPIAGSEGTLRALVNREQIPARTNHLVLHAGWPCRLGGMEVTSFRAYHDCSEPTGYIIDDGDASLAVLLDTNRVSDSMLTLLKTADAVVIESNYSETALKTDLFPPCPKCRGCGADCRGRRYVLQTYNQDLKDRIRYRSHMSNERTADVVRKLKDDVGTIALAHLSENYNRPNLARLASEEAVGESGCRLFVADQHPLYFEKRMVRFTV